MRVSSPASSNKHNSTLSAFSEKSEKFVPSPSQVAPSGKGLPGQVSISLALDRDRAVSEVGDELDLPPPDPHDTRRVVSEGGCVPREPPAEAEQVGVELAQAGELLARELAVEEGLLGLGIGDVAGKTELAAAALACGLSDPRVDVVGEELERPPLAVLLAHEQERRLRREE